MTSGTAGAGSQPAPRGGRLFRWGTAPLLLVSFFLSVPTRAQILSSGAVRIALIDNILPHFTQEDLEAPLRRLLLQFPSSGTLRNIEFLPCYYSGSDYRFRIPDGLGTVPDQAPAAVLETEAAVAIISPPIPALVAGLLRAGQDPSSFEALWSVHPATRSLALSMATTPSGDSLVTALIDPSQGEGARWHNTAAALARLRWEGQDAYIIMVGKGFGGLGRLATALQRERSHGPPIIGVSHQDILGDPLAELKGTALTDALSKLGLAYSAVGSAEIFNWADLARYRGDHPDGIQLLSANLVYSSAPTVSFLPDHVMVEAGGLKVAITAITSPDANRYLARSGLGHLTVRDPLPALEERLPKFREQADVVVLLAHAKEVSMDLRLLARGVDLILAESGGEPTGTQGSEMDVIEKGRKEYEPPLATLRDYPLALDIAEVSVERRPGGRDMHLRSRTILLDESVPIADSFSEFEPESFGITFSTEPPLIPAARDIFPPAAQAREIGDREFWTMAADLIAEETGSEAGLLRAWPRGVPSDAGIKESLLRVWLRYDDQPVRLSLKGSQLKALMAESRSWNERAEGIGGEPAFVIGGLGPAGTTTVHGVPVEPNDHYRVTTTQIFADILGLPAEREPVPGNRSMADIVLAALRKRQGSQPGCYRDWMEGRPIREKGLWRIDFRDVSLNLQNTQVVRDDAFNSVSNPRIQGSNELLIAGEVRTDADYLLRDYKWGNTLELDYARSSLRPRNQPPITNVTANRLSLTTSGTRRLGAIPTPWLARSWGPSLAFNYETQLEATPPLRRRQIFSAYPGVEFYDGAFVRSLRLAANIKRDYSVDPVHTQYGLRTRALLARDFGPGPVKFEGEAWANYFFLTDHDQPQDLRWESDVNFKLRIPIFKHLTIAPFLDFYSFALKTRPLWGYSAMTGVSLGFSRVWKPQYEKF
ncbi:MAG: hypothetical protein NTY77_19685 [Elusimicrobia bacterium]|nr:hypothetical protein [Elusimicrobiota bacterium]